VADLPLETLVEAEAAATTPATTAAAAAATTESGTTSLGPLGGTITINLTRAAGPGTIQIGPSVIPAGGQLLHIADSQRWHVLYEAGPVTIAYEIGDPARARVLFGANWQQAFGGFITMTQQDYTAAGYLERGLIDEQVGATESINSQITRGVREARFEDIPGWIRVNSEAMRIVTVAALEGWSSGRTLRELQHT